jgi:hypothetical protein
MPIAFLEDLQRQVSFSHTLLSVVIIMSHAYVQFVSLTSSISLCSLPARSLQGRFYPTLSSLMNIYNTAARVNDTNIVARVNNTNTVARVDDTNTGALSVRFVLKLRVGLHTNFLLV